MKLSSLFLCSILCTLVLASLSTSDIPLCALKCSIQIIPTTNCSLLDPAPCVCPNVPLLSSLSTCVQQNCTYAEQLVSVAYQSQICEAYPPIPSKSGYVQKISIVMFCVTVPFLALRTLSRWLVTGNMGADDWVFVAATVCFLITAALEISAATKGFGSHYWTIDPSRGPTLLKMFFSTQFFYLIIQGLAKISILLLYLRIFPSRLFRIMCYLNIFFIALCSLTFCFVALFQCTPVRYFWDKRIDGKCIDVSTSGYVIAAISIFEDLVILMLPVRELWSLKVDKGKRLGLIIMFSVGGFACITSIVRLHYLAQYITSYDITYDNVNILIWSSIETNVALICVSLPALRPLILTIIPKVYRDYFAKGMTEATATVTKRTPWYMRANQEGSGTGIETYASRTTESYKGGVEVQKEVVTELKPWEEAEELGILTEVTVAESKAGNRMSWIKGKVHNLASKGTENRVSLHFKEDAEMELVEKESESEIDTPSQ